MSDLAIGFLWKVVSDPAIKCMDAFFAGAYLDSGSVLSFCQAEPNVVPGTKASGVIYSPNYEFGSYWYDSGSKFCKIYITVQRDSIIALQLKRKDVNSSGPCLKDMVIGEDVVKGICPEQKVRAGKGTINITLELGKISRPSFQIFFQGKAHS